MTHEGKLKSKSLMAVRKFNRACKLYPDSPLWLRKKLEQDRDLDKYLLKIAQAGSKRVKH